MEVAARILSDIISKSPPSTDSVYEIHIDQTGLDYWCAFPDEFIESLDDAEEGVKLGKLRRREKR